MKMAKWLMILGLGLMLAACGDESSTAQDGSKKPAQQETALGHAEKHLDPTYVCPMHPQIIRDEPGSCPICGMDLVEKQVEPEPEKETALSHAEKHLDPTYVCPMHPQIIRDEPGNCPICGMDLVLKEQEASGSGDEITVKVSPRVVNSLGVRTAKAERDTLWKKIDTVGYVDYDESKITHVHLRTRGWIEKLYVESEGERVRQGQLLYEVYAPELVTAQEEYVQALGSGHKGLIKASRERLLALGVAEDQIEQLRKTRRVSQYIKGYASQDGIVASLGVREGMFVMPSTEVMSLADLSSIWIQAEVFESQVAWVAAGQPADVQLSYYPGRTWEGRVEYVYPKLNPGTRTLRVRLRFDNPGETLKPNMFADVAIYGGPQRNVVMIPEQALIREGKENRVILAMGEGRFQPRKVVPGINSGGWVEIRSGLKAGEEVVTSAQFLIDSEASLKASIQRMSSSATQMSTEKQPAPITGSGVLHELMPEENKVNMTHGPIPEIDWPQMTMPFRVAPNVKLDQFQPDDKVEFELEEVDDGYVIKSMRKR